MQWFFVHHQSLENKWGKLKKFHFFFSFFPSVTSQLVNAQWRRVEWCLSQKHKKYHFFFICVICLLVICIDVWIAVTHTSWYVNINRARPGGGLGVLNPQPQRNSQKLWLWDRVNEQWKLNPQVTGFSSTAQPKIPRSSPECKASNCFFSFLFVEHICR